MTGIHCRCGAAALGLAALCGVAASAARGDERATGGGAVADAQFADAIAAAQQRCVKLYGAAIGREKGYGTGVVVSADGVVVTALSGLLEGERLRVVFPDGRRSPAQVVARDTRRQLALLKTEKSTVQHFDLSVHATAQPGDWVIAATNCFKIAAGDEPVTAAAGVLSARAPLEAHRRAQDVNYEGAVLFVDVVVSSPGSAGGALVDLQGRLLGVIGRPVQNSLTNTWANYAIPVEEVAAFVADASRPPDTSAHLAAAGAAKPDKPGPSAAAGKPDLGITLFAIGGRSKPAYIERVRRDSPAARAGLRANDLILAYNGRAIGSCEEFDAQFAAARPGDTLELSVKRGDQVVAVKVTLGARP